MPPGTAATAGGLDTEVSSSMPEPNVGDVLVAKVDELVGKAANILNEIRAVTEQLHPERVRSCRNAITMRP